MEGIQLTPCNIRYNLWHSPVITIRNSKFLPPLHFRDEAHAFKVTDGPIGQELAKSLIAAK
jgi:hypothetical protein